MLSVTLPVFIDIKVRKDPKDKTSCNFSLPPCHVECSWWKASLLVCTRPPLCPVQALQTAGCVCWTRPTAQSTSLLSTSPCRPEMWSLLSAPTLRSVQVSPHNGHVLRDSGAHVFFLDALQGRQVFEQLKQLESKGIKLQIAVNAPQTSAQETAELAATGGNLMYSMYTVLYFWSKTNRDERLIHFVFLGRCTGQRGGPQGCDWRNSAHQAVGG